MVPLRVLAGNNRMHGLTAVLLLDTDLFTLSDKACLRWANKSN